jgi:hypothetical protein
MAGAWSISRPAGGGAVAVLVRGAGLQPPANNTRSVYPNPAKPFQFPAVSCNASISTEPNSGHQRRAHAR